MRNYTLESAMESLGNGKFDTEFDNLRISLYNLLKICCDTQEKFISANYLMTSILYNAKHKVEEKITEEVN